MTRLLFIASLCTSAFLLFSLQPMVGKMLLPYLGGAPAVWNTALVFFQVLLLGGYLYAHGMARFIPLRWQPGVHLALLLTGIAFLPIALPAVMDVNEQSPVAWQLGIMAAMVGLPFFLLSASAPLFQHWFARTAGHDTNPYPLYAASNLGSFAGLLAYPFVIETLTGLKTQGWLWAGGYAVLCAGVGLILIAVIRTGTGTAGQNPVAADNAASVTWRQRLTWIFLAFCPSSLLMGVTSHVTTDIAAIPLFWVVPLALYLLSFIMAFSDAPLIKLSITRLLFASTVCVLAGYLLLPMSTGRLEFMAFLVAAVFVVSLLCHQELYALKPGASRLTEFYLLLSLGGALGGMFNALLAPQIFTKPYELTIALTASMAAYGLSFATSHRDEIKAYLTSPNLRASNFLLFPGVLLAVLAVTQLDLMGILGFAAALPIFIGLVILRRQRLFFIITIIGTLLLNPLTKWEIDDNVLFIKRNFFGVLKVEQEPDERGLIHGTTIHGAQPTNTLARLVPGTYYHPEGAAGDIFRFLDQNTNPAQRIAAFGLGTGSIACYTKPGRHFTFFEIDPLVPEISTNPDYFTYLSDCGSPYEIVIGDGRLTIQNSPDKSYDLIFLDAFTSDTIPVHVMTVEAIAQYKKKLADGGFIAVHISNRFFDLEPELALIAKAVGLTALVRNSEEGPIWGTDLKYYATRYVVLLDRPSAVMHFKEQGWIDIETPEALRPWSDDYSNLLRALNL